jgi:phosphoribosyl-AMP cyclohydrolase
MELLDTIKFDDKGLVATIVQDADDGEVLMVAYMNRESLELTMKEGRTVFFSRSRQELWRKGDTSGHTQQVVDLRVDCDADALLVRVKQVGPACHNNYRSCFFRQTDETGNLSIISEKMED